MALVVGVYTQRAGITGKAWDITYTASGSEGAALSVVYQDTASRYLWGDRSVREHVEPNVHKTWSKNVLLAANRQAKVTVTPQAGASATCRIVLDGKKELAQSTSAAPGQPAVCIADLD
ncbi:hypothetical protein [Streptomyces sp. NPDC046371]